MINFTHLGWWLCVKSASSPSMSPKDVLFIMGVAIVVECEATAVPLLVFTVPGMRLKISTHMTSNWDFKCNVEALKGLGLWRLDNSDNFLMASCCCSIRADKQWISWLWVFTSSACWRCRHKRTDTCSLCHLFLHDLCKLLILCLQFL